MVWKAALAALLVAAPGYAQSSDWVVFSTTPSGTKWSIRLADAGKGKGLHEVWFKGDHAADKAVEFRQTMALYRINCDTGQIGLMQMTRYLASGKAEDTPYRGYVSMQRVVPDSVGQAWFDVVCIAFDE